MVLVRGNEMKKSRIRILMTLTLLWLGIPGVPAQASLNNCFELKFPSSSMSSTRLSLNADVYAKCTKAQLGSAWAGRFVFSVEEENNLGGLGVTVSCSGPLAEATLFAGGSTRIGTLTCEIRIAEDFFGSLRTGATSSTLRMWSAWDFSTWTISVSHQSIPYSCPYIGGCSSGSSGGSSGGSSTPLVPQCSSAPKTPILSLTWDDKGVTFVVKRAEGGENPTSLYWNYTLYDSATEKWGNWVGWTSFSPSETLSKQFAPQAGKSRIAFGVYATNNCGNSEQARERSENTGVPLAVLQKDEIKDFSSLIRPAYGDKPRKISEHVFSANGLPVSFESLSTDICTLSSDELTVVKPGVCRISVKGSSQFNLSTADTIEVKVQIQKGLEKISARDTSPLGVDESRLISINSIGNPKFSVEILGSTESCETINNEIRGRKVGFCAIKVVSSESEFYGSAQTSFVLEVVKSANTIIGFIPEQMVATDKLSLSLSPQKSTTLRIVSLTPSICSVNIGQLMAASGGNCEIRVTAEENERYLRSERDFKVTINRQVQNLVATERSFVATTRKGEFAPPVTLSSGLIPAIRSLTPRSCTSTQEGKVLPKSAGECRIAVSHPGSSIFEPSKEVLITGFIVNDGIEIVCIKGKTIKKVSGTKPKCPTGFKKQ